MRYRRDPYDINKLAYEIVADVTEDRSPEPPPSPVRTAAGRKGGVKGGVSRANKLSKSQRSAIAKKAAFARWKRD